MFSHLQRLLLQPSAPISLVFNVTRARVSVFESPGTESNCEFNMKISIIHVPRQPGEKRVNDVDVLQSIYSGLAELWWGALGVCKQSETFFQASGGGSTSNYFKSLKHLFVPIRVKLFGNPTSWKSTLQPCSLLTIIYSLFTWENCICAMHNWCNFISI